MYACLITISKCMHATPYVRSTFVHACTCSMHASSFMHACNEVSPALVSYILELLRTYIVRQVVDYRPGWAELGCIIRRWGGGRPGLWGGWSGPQNGPATKSKHITRVEASLVK